MLMYEEFRDHIFRNWKVFTPHKYQEWEPVIYTEELVDEKVDYLSYTVDSPNKAAPCICLDTAYKVFREREIIYDAYLYALETLAYEKMHFNDLDLLSDWNFCKTRVVLKLVNPEYEDIGYSLSLNRPFLDLSVIYELTLMINHNWTQRIMVTDYVVRRWGITEDELYKVALANTLYKAFFCYANDLDVKRQRLIEAGCDSEWIQTTYEAGKKEATMYKLWDKKNVCTSAILLAKPFLKEVAEEMGASIYLMAFSNCWQAISAAGMTKEEVSDYHDSLVDQFFLNSLNLMSTTMYYYDLETDTVSLVEWT